jgi:hypothetical protein
MRSRGTGKSAISAAQALSNHCRESLKVILIVQEMAVLDGVESLDALYHTAPERLRRYCDLAHAALRGIKHGKKCADTPATTAVESFPDG